MHGPYYILPLFVLLIASSICEQHRPPDVDGASFVSTEGVDWHRTNSMSLESNEEYDGLPSSGDGFLDRTTLSQDSIQGSGDGPGRSGSEDDESDFGRGELEGSGIEGSGNFPVSGLTPCQQSAVEAKESRASNYVPRCNKKGEFAARQCDRNSADCWCVNLSGVEVPGSRRTHPATARCKDQYHTFIVDGKPGGNAQPDEVDTPSPVDTTDGFIIETHKDKDNEPNADISTINSQPGDLETKQPISRPSIIGKPGMLAGIICAAVVGLLCAVLLVMFIVYRMRKKDEGSYALDEPKRSPSLTYTKASKDNREFFA